MWTSRGPKNVKLPFLKLKEYLSKPSVMSRPIEREEFLIYLAVTAEAVSVILVRGEN